MIPNFDKDKWTIINTIRMSSGCRYLKRLNKCSHPSYVGRSKKCTFKKCPIAVDRVCKKAGECMFSDKPEFESIIKIC